MSYLKKHLKLIIIVISTIIILLIVSLMFLNKKNDKIKIEDTLSHIFYYLEKDEYKNMNEISDFCKLALVYNTDYLKSDTSVYDGDNKKVKAYTTANLLLAVKKILGNDATISFKTNDEGNYDFVEPNNCQFGNIESSNLTFDNNNVVIYPYKKSKSNHNLMIKWQKKISGQYLELSAKALMIVKSDDSYDLYIDSNMEHKIGTYKSLNEAQKAAADNYDQSYDYKMKLKYENNNYTWLSYERIKTSEEVIYD